MARILFTNVSIFENTEANLAPGEVLVQGNRIEAVAKPGQTLQRTGCEVVDAGGANAYAGARQHPLSLVLR
jgi:hypothetical protein